jgi:hypothetical protein
MFATLSDTVLSFWLNTPIEDIRKSNGKSLSHYLDLPILNENLDDVDDNAWHKAYSLTINNERDRHYIKNK